MVAVYPNGKSDIMGGIIVKYFPNCHRYDEDKFSQNLPVALTPKQWKA